MWKVAAAVLNKRLTSYITFHDFLQGFWAGHSAGTTTPEAKLLHRLAALMGEVLYVIFMDLQKAYDALDRSRCLEILCVYVVGPQAFGILQTYCIWLRVVAKAVGYYGVGFKGARGVTQGDPLSPTIFNVVVDAVLQHRISVMMEGA